MDLRRGKPEGAEKDRHGRQQQSCRTMPATLTLEDSKALLALCRTGRLYEIEDWIKAGKSLQVAESLRTTPLQVAIKTGFRSLIELLVRNESQVEIKNKALADVIERPRMELVELLVNHGAEISSVPFEDVLRTWDPKIIRFFLDHGADAITGRPFAVAFGERVRSSLRIFKDYQESHPEMASQLKEQAERALRFFSYEGNLKWVSLMLWLGADPRVKGPRLFAHSEDDPECDATAIEEACLGGKLDVPRRFKLNPEIDDISEFLKEAAFFGYADVTGYLLDLGAKPNDKANGGSSALDRCFWHVEIEDSNHIRYGRLISRYGVCRTFDTIEILVEAGAQWKPDERYSILRFRRMLLKMEPKLVIDLFKVLKTHGACSEETVRNFLDTPKMRQHLEEKEWHLQRLGLKCPSSRSSTPYGLLARFNREKLYQEVWSQPMWKLAPQYRISDVAFAKTCRKLQVPLPGRGYWAKLAAGKRVKGRPPLPPFPVVAQK